MILKKLIHFSQKHRIYYILIAFFLGSFLTYTIYGGNSSKVQNSKSADSNLYCIYKFNRVKGYEFVKPLLSVEQNCESKNYVRLRSKLVKVVDSLKMVGNINQASVYFFKRGEWISLNPDEQYHPASLMKVCMLLTILRKAEATPGFLTKKVLFNKPDSIQITKQYFDGPKLKQGKYYTVHELLLYMIAHSDNNASWLLSKFISDSDIKSLFKELGLNEPDMDINRLSTNTHDFSVFIKAIYNSVYLSPEYSNYAATILSKCDFKEGFVKGFPPKTKLWHKFGQFKVNEATQELHESGIFFINGHSYLLTVMTRGREPEKLAKSIEVISRSLYNEIAGP